MDGVYYHKYKITHYQYLILLNKEFRRFGNRKIILNPLWQHCKVMMYAYVFVYIVLPLIKKKLLHSLGLVYKSMRGMVTNSIDRDQWLNVTSESRDRI
jgi:hypothetical protein